MRGSVEEVDRIGVESENFIRGKNNMAKLNENLSKLKLHLESLKQRQLPPGDAADLVYLGGNVNTGPTAVSGSSQRRSSLQSDVNGILKDKRNSGSNQRRRTLSDQTPVHKLNR